MNTIRTHHWPITGVLFAIAIALYIAGFSTGASAVIIAAAIVETLAWVSLLRKRPITGSKEVGHSESAR